MNMFNSKTASVLSICLLMVGHVFAQARINFGNTFAVFTGGTSTNPIYLNIGNSNANAVIRTGTGHAISSNEFQRIRWQIGTSTGNYEFPFGKNTTDYVPFKANITTAGVGSGHFDVATWHAPGTTPSPAPSGYSLCPSSAKVMQRFWRIDPGSYTTNPTANIRFHYLGSELNSIPENMLQAQRGNLLLSCPWEYPPVGTVNTVNDYVEVTSVSQFSPWALSHQNFPLPVTLLSFSAQWINEGDAAAIEWQTVEERNNAYFEVERSSGLNFTSIARVPSMEDESYPRKYTHIDPQPLMSKYSYYRLKQVDKDGRASFSKVVVLERNTLKPMLRVRPNPTRNELTFDYFSNQKDEKVFIEIIDNLGRVVYSGETDIRDSATYKINVQHLAAGAYILKVISGEDTQFCKFIIE